ncbi:mitochondrial nucleoid-associated protein 1 [Ara ararauna]
MGAPGPERCPHCHRPFKRLRSHLPFCRAAPSAAPGPGKSGGSPPGRAEREAARPLGSPREEVKGGPEALWDGVEVVIEKHRARVVRGESGAGGRGASAGAAGNGRGAQRGTAGGGSAPTGPRGTGAAGKAPPSSKRGKGGSKAAEAPVRGAAPGATGSSGPGDPVLREGTGRTALEGKRGHPEAGAGREAPVPALHSKNGRLSVMEALGGRSEGTSKRYLTSAQQLSESKQQMVSEPVRSARRDAELAPHQPALRASQSHPICLPRAPGRSTQAGALGLEWFPDLHPNYDRLSMFPGKPFHEDVGIAVKTPTGNFSEGQQGPLLERRLMDVRLGELPLWVTTRDFSPQALLGGIQRAWDSYYNKYINVKKGGPAGVSMLLAGYCFLSYAWNYQHIKRYRWRKYH